MTCLINSSNCGLQKSNNTTINKQTNLHNPIVVCKNQTNTNINYITFP